jgi:glycosyltransferase involved in cell wall biosynthesis
MRRASRIVAVADELAREATETFGIPTHRVVMIPSAIDPARVLFRHGRAVARRQLQISARATVVLSLAALAWEKDPLAQLAVAIRVLEKRPEALYLAAGDGPLWTEVEAEVKRAGMVDRVRLLGSISDVGPLLAASDVLVLASRTEGSPACIIEAGLAGLPVAAYALGGIPELIEDGVTGRLTPPGSVDALAQAVLEILSSRPTRDLMGRRARERCRAHEIGQVAPRYEALYRELSGAPASAPIPVS